LSSSLGCSRLETLEDASGAPLCVAAKNRDAKFSVATDSCRAAVDGETVTKTAALGDGDARESLKSMVSWDGAQGLSQPMLVFAAK